LLVLVSPCLRKLQQIFIELTLEAEQAEYAAEGLPWRHIPFNDNKPLCALIEGKPGLLSLCDDCCATNKSDSNFMMDLKNYFADGALSGFIKCQQNEFIISHYAGKVKYATEGLLAKNKDTLGDDLILVMQSSRRALARDHGWMDLEISVGQKKRPLTVGFQFKQQVTLLMHELHKSMQYYVRCIKTNTEKKANLFDAVNVARQVQYLGLLENIKVRRAGYAYRNEFDAFVKRSVVRLRGFFTLGSTSDETFSSFLIFIPIRFFRSQIHCALEDIERRSHK
jgi:myosin-1